MLKNRAVILAKIETTYGTDAVPTAADNAILCSAPEIEPIVKKVERPNLRQSFGMDVPVIVGEGLKITLSAESKGSGVVGTPPEIGPLLRACNLAETIVAATSVAYDPHSDGLSGESLTIYFYRHDLLHKVVGCRGTVDLNASVNENGLFNFEFHGIYAGPVDGNLPTPTVNTIVPPLVRAAALAFDSYAVVASLFKLNVGNTINPRRNINAATGIDSYFIGDRKVTAEIDPEVVPLATKDFWAIWAASQGKALSCTIGSVAGNICTITAANAAIDDLKYADRDNLLTYQMPLILAPTSGDDEFSIIFT